MLPALYCDEIAGLKSYPKTNSWEEGTDCCSWDGVSCDHLNAHVIALCSKLAFWQLPLNTSLFLLPHLQKLNLAFNNFNQSKIPSEFGRFTGLLYLNLSHTGFVGVVPSQVSHLSKLVSLDLSWIDEQLTIDKYALEGLVHNLTEALKYLGLSGNSFFQGLFVSITILSSLEDLIISDAYFFGGLPESIGNLVSLKFLDLSHSNLSGPIPRSLGNLLQLTHLNLGWNKLSGQIPLSILNLTQLEYLKIAGNSLEGSIPDEVTTFLYLISLDLTNNLLNGTLPSWLYFALSLKTIYLSQNQFSGNIKEFQSKSLEYLYLKNNKLQGPLPSSIFQLLNLTKLILSSNNLTGVIEFSLNNICFQDFVSKSLLMWA
ncbi:hypothetical protein E1A91_D05G436000v1 [Gossypium mustelinum]|uniref:Leucine-rich repeat-containing N-terminal plant-type domain-containing protein n=1 Tax=Gossypium mustelinum TaxID=34275 RepID=A0A5D2V7Q2_GOSMU|nr:hypothetical protein E1A91_D05G436000v1 [Gossypium mustelinum]